MNKNFKLSVFIFILYLTLFLPELNANSESLVSNAEPTISMDFQDANLKDILKVFSIQAGLNFIASEAVQERKVTLYLDKVPLQKAMDKLFKANNLSYELDEESNIFLVRDWGRPQMETVTKIFYLKNSTVSSSSLKEEMRSQLKVVTEIEVSSGAGGGGAGAGGGGGEESGKWKSEEESGITRIVKKLLSEYGSVIEDFRTNSLIVTDIPSRMEIITQTIAVLDVPVPQVMLEVEMLDVSKNTIDKVGIKFGDTASYPDILTMTLTGAMRGTKFPLSAWWQQTGMPDRKGTDYTAPGTVSFATAYQVLLSFIRAQTDTKVLARPRILTLNNEPAEITTLTSEVIGVKTNYDDNGNVVSTEAERTDTGVSLRVTPQINLETNEITMFITPKVVDASTSAFSNSFRDPEGRGTKSLIRIKDGETVIIGGLIRHDIQETVTKLPILGDIPLLGSLFRHRDRTKGRERELLVFITPHIIRNTDIELAKAKKVTLPEREQNTVSGINRQAIIGTSLNSFEKKR